MVDAILVMDTATREWDTLIMVEQAWVVVRVLQAGRFTSIQSSRTVLEFQRSQEQQQEQQQQQQQQHCQQDWIVRSVKNNGRDPDSPTTILAMFNPRAEEISHRGLDLKTGSMATVLTGASSTITSEAIREIDVTNRAAAGLSEEDVQTTHTAPLEVQNEISAKDCRQAETLAAGQEILQGPPSHIHPCLRITLTTAARHPSLEEEVQDRFPAG